MKQANDEASKSAQNQLDDGEDEFLEQVADEIEQSIKPTIIKTEPKPTTTKRNVVKPAALKLVPGKLSMKPVNSNTKKRSMTAGPSTPKTPKLNMSMLPISKYMSPKEVKMIFVV